MGWIAASTFLVLMFNSAILIVASIFLKERGPNGYPTFLPRDCATASRWSQGLHFMINIFATALLGASNYYIQRLSACTRAEMDRAHRKDAWVDVGVSGIRNTRFVGRKKLLLWCGLACSSLPIHIL